MLDIAAIDNGFRDYGRELTVRAPAWQRGFHHAFHRLLQVFTKERLRVGRAVFERMPGPAAIEALRRSRPVFDDATLVQLKYARRRAAQAVGAVGSRFRPLLKAATDALFRRAPVWNDFRRAHAETCTSARGVVVEAFRRITGAVRRAPDMGFGLGTPR